MLQRPLDGLWAGLWEPLSAIGEGSDEAKASLVSKHFESAKLTYFCEIRHILTHREVRARIYEVSGKLKHDPKFIYRVTRGPGSLEVGEQSFGCLVEANAAGVALDFDFRGL